MTKGYTAYIKSKREVLFSDEVVADIVAALKSGRLPRGRTTRKTHLASLQSRHESTTTCPKCGAALVERSARSGPNAGKPFLGCSAFPKCRFTRPMPAEA